ncbi:MAG: formylglycine-generating enzyme family protein, partial [Alphaproteobacteria bacterium]
MCDGLDAGTLGEGKLPDPTVAIEDGGHVLIVGDLGRLRVASDQALAGWVSFANRLERAGWHCCALSPVPPAAYPKYVRNHITIIPWEDTNSNSLPADKERQRQVDLVLGLVAHAFKISPGLLRTVRRMVPGATVVTEIDAWNSDYVAGASSRSMHLNAKGKALADLAENGDLARLRMSQDKIFDWCGGEGFPSIYLDSIWSLGHLSRQVVDPAHLAAAENLIRAMHGRIRGEVGRRVLPYLDDTKILSFVGEMAERTRHGPTEMPEIQALYQDLLAAAEERGFAHSVPEDFDPQSYEPGGAPHPMRLVQLGRLVHGTAQETGEGHQPELKNGPSANPRAKSEAIVQGSPLGTIMTRNRRLQGLVSNFWASGIPPEWAQNWGMDPFGPWVTFLVPAEERADVVVRMRWIPAGSFLMGSPEDEKGRFSDEGPQHRVTLSRGFWLFDTPVTQAVWQAVMGENPSRFKGEDRPVERVRWHDADAFLARLNARLPGLDLALPTEAEWEYAVRAGTTGPTYARGDQDLDDLAWYTANSDGTTHPVAQKSPNPWGLYDMLGNVWEWCADGLRPYDEDPKTDPAGPQGSPEGSSSRALRGGAWCDLARDVRAAGRGADAPDSRNDVGIGFRCARVRPGAEPVGTGQGGAERRPAPAPSGKAAVFARDSAEHPATASLPQGAPFVIRSDCEILTFEPVTRPDWAQRIGRDRFGLWADFFHKDVRQRLRWINPGRFTMGSPNDEPGRFDNEGPRHEVTLTRGYWLFDTPVTQALWESVMGTNPSRFVSSTRPVEQVSWMDVQDFLRAVNRAVPGLDLGLPTEAQWEYACRAGVAEATYAGAIEILGERNAPVLDAIAWYGGNSGIGFELDNGYDSSDWQDKQYEHSRAGTHPVARKVPNPWGLYDMLGNVWEWCA